MRDWGWSEWDSALGFRLLFRQRLLLPRLWVQQFLPILWPVHGKCIMIWSPDASLCASLLSSSLGTKVSFQGNNKTKNYNVGRWQCNVGFVLCDDKIARWNETIVREDKLIKTVVVHNGNYPIRYYMFLFPDTPQFQTDLGEPLVLTPLIQSGQTQRARQELQCY